MLNYKKISNYGFINLKSITEIIKLYPIFHKIKKFHLCV